MSVRFPFALLLLAACASPPAPRSALCDATATPVGVVQGDRGRSPSAGREVTVRGTVVGDFQAPDQLAGFFLQGEPDDARGTADGLFVVAATPDVRPGDLVTVRGVVGEVDKTTSVIEVGEVAVCGSGTVRPATIDLPKGNLERFEGMLVTFPQTLTVTDVHALGSEGRLVLFAGGRPFAPTDRRLGPDAPDPRDLRLRLVVDDGSRTANPSVLPVAEARVPRVGDTVTGASGILAQGPGGWALEPLAPISVAPRNPRPATPPAVAGGVRVASFNVLNYFTSLGERGAATAGELERQRGKIVAALTALNPDVVALIELENRPQVAVDLVAALDAAAGAPGTWAAVAEPPGGLGDDEIRVGLLYRPAVLTPVGSPAADHDPLHSRAPLAQTFAAGEERFTVVVTHLKSKRCDGATGADADRDDGVGCWNAARIQQARRLLAFVAALQERSGDRDVLVVGDLNAHPREEPVGVLTRGGLVDLAARFVPDGERYSFVFQGLSGTLDYAFATRELAGRAAGAAIWHVNADEAPFLAYDGGGRPDAPVALDPFRSSDHDPLLIGLDLTSR